MPISEAHKRANAKWDQANLMTLGVRLKRTDAMAFKEYAASQGKTANALLKEYVLKCLYPEDNPQTDGHSVKLCVSDIRPNQR
jgi:hypothetical protein